MVNRKCKWQEFLGIKGNYFRRKLDDIIILKDASVLANGEASLIEKNSVFI